MMKSMIRILCLIFPFILLANTVLPQQQINPRSFNQAYKRGESYFYKALKKYAPEYKLSPEDNRLLRKAEKKFPRLYRHLMNFYFHTHSAETTEEGEFPSFVLSQSINMAKELLQSVSLKYIQQDSSPLNTVLTSAGYYSRKNIPNFRKFFRPLSRYLYAQWAFQEARFKTAHTMTKGEGTTIAVIDSGVDPTIKEINANIRNWKNFLDASKPVHDKGKFPYDWGGHGTSVATLIFQAAPKAQTTVIKIHDNERMHTVAPSRWPWYLVTAGIRWAVQNNADIISLSVSVNKDFKQIRKACKICWENNVILVAPLGNAFEETNKTLIFYPAAYPWSIAVGGVEKNEDTLRVWEFSSPGDYIDVMAPASRIIVESPSYLEDPKPPQVLHGNSLAVPIVAGAAALILSSMDDQTLKELKKKPGKLVETVRNILRTSSSNEKLGYDKPNPVSGYGLIDVDKAVRLAKKWKPEKIPQ
ncbi:MAG: S8 family serine peptidase [Candidatus Aminicenantes bacterium]|nr:S8 family serine peptidase [Candidatus Aminicenantes bacterium]